MIHKLQELLNELCVINVLAFIQPNRFVAFLEIQKQQILFLEDFWKFEILKIDWILKLNFLFKNRKKTIDICIKNFLYTKI